MQKVKEIYCKNRSVLRQWLLKNHDVEKSVWLVYDKTIDGKPRALPYSAIVEEVLCFGWIDSTPRKRSQMQAMLYLSKRKPKSEWSKLNKSRLEKLMRDNLMHPSGLEAIRIAKENGSWSKIDSVENLEIPDDLKTRMKKGDWEYFDMLSKSKKKMLLHRIDSAKTPETRENRIRFVMKLIRLHLKPSDWYIAMTKGIFPSGNK